MTIKKRLIRTFVCVMCVAVLAMGIGAASLIGAGMNLNQVQEETIPAVNELGLVKRNLIATLSNTLEMMLLDDTEYIASLKEDNSSHETTMGESVALIQRSAKSERLEAISGYLEQIARIRKEVEKAAGTDEERAFLIYQEEFSPLVIKTVTELDTFTEEYTAEVEKDLNAKQTRRIFVSVFGMLVFAAGCIVSVRMMSGTVRAIMKPVDEVNRALIALSEGRLSYEFTYRSEDEFREMCDNIRFSMDELNKYVTEISTELSEFAQGNFARELTLSYVGDFKEIGHSIENVQQRIAEIMKEMRAASRQVEASSEQIAATSQELAHGSVEQAGAVEQLTASINEILEQTKKSADRAKETSMISRQAEQGAVYGNEKVSETSIAIREIEEKSKEIENIINMIEQIASQTRLLSLNASIEAARAGETGRGFAVVATEVGNLAAESAEAAKSIGHLINDMALSVQKGVSLMSQTEEALANVVDQARGIDGHIAEMAQAAKEQAVIIEQISIGADQISAVVQTNSAFSQESAATAEELSGQAVTLEQMMERFHTKV